MNNLWRKETTQAGYAYVDLFATVPQNERNFLEVIKLAECLKSYNPIKNNAKATEFRLQGNEVFRLKHWSEAMQLYNQSLCFAEVGTEEVAMAYANRSACFFQMQKYDEVLADIELAKSVNLPDRLVSKLEQRKRESLKLMKSKVEAPTKQVTQLSYPAHRNYPCLAEVVDIKQNAEFGRHLVAMQDIPVGKIVLFEEDFVTQATDNNLVCETCFCEDANFIACPKCSDVVFCSIECMNRNLTHNWECGSVPKSIQNDDLVIWYNAVRFQIRVLFLALQIFGSVECLMEFVDGVLKEHPEKVPTSLHDLQSKYHFFFKLKGSVPLSDAFEFFYTIYKSVHSLSKINDLFNTEEKQRFLGHLVLHHFLVTHINSFGAIITKSVTNVLSMLNHSCYPNLYTVCTGKHQWCVTVRPIKKGDQLFVSYLQGERNSLEERQKELKNHWNFVCKCSQCNPSVETHGGAPITEDPKFDFVTLNYKDDEKLPIVLENCVQLLNEYGEYSWSSELADVVDIFTLLFADQLR